MEKGKFSSWLFGIANNCCIDAVRKKKREKIDDLASSEGMDRLQSGSDDPEDQMIKVETAEWLELAVADLPVEQKQVVLLRIFGEMPFKDIAELLKCPLNTVLGRMHYAVKNLQKMSHSTYQEASENGLS